MVMCTRAKVAHDDQQKKKLPIIRARINFLSALVLSRFGAHQTAAATVKSSTTISGQQPLSVRPAHHAHHGVLPSDRRPAKEGGQDRTEDNPFGMDPSLNVYGEKLEQCGTQPMTGFFRDGVRSGALGKRVVKSNDRQTLTSLALLSHMCTVLQHGTGRSWLAHRGGRGERPVAQL